MSASAKTFKQSPLENRVKRALTRNIYRFSVGLLCLLLPILVPAVFLSFMIGKEEGGSALPFAVDSLCIVNDPAGTLDAFYEELAALAAGKDTVVNIIHLGDSHIQAGYFSGRTMRLLHERFGNAGRGWIAPLKIGRTNEPDDYFIRSLVKDWTVGRCVQLRPQCDTGIGGIGLRTVSPFVNFDIVMTPLHGAGYAYNQVIAYRGFRATPLLPGAAMNDSARVNEGTFKDLKLMTDTIRLPRLTDSLQLQSTRRKAGTDSILPFGMFDNLYFGFSLTNGQPGILYHSIGINGAMFVHYTSDVYVRRLALLRPSLLIVSLGTNESFNRRFDVEEFTGQVEAFVALIKKHIPQTAILLVTPPECFRRTVVNRKRVYVRNENTAKIARTLVRVAEEHELACWDFFLTTGGKGSSEDWLKGKWMSRDRIHFNREAYYEQGVLLFKALINGIKADD
jgi:lysophospholipase L1-like esterase